MAGLAMECKFKVENGFREEDVVVCLVWKFVWCLLLEVVTIWS
jgi:hypothetical protein